MADRSEVNQGADSGGSRVDTQGWTRREFMRNAALWGLGLAAAACRSDPIPTVPATSKPTTPPTPTIPVRPTDATRPRPPATPAQTATLVVPPTDLAPSPSPAAVAQPTATSEATAAAIPADEFEVCNGFINKEGIPEALSSDRFLGTPEGRSWYDNFRTWTPDPDNPGWFIVGDGQSNALRVSDSGEIVEKMPLPFVHFRGLVEVTAGSTGQRWAITFGDNHGAGNTSNVIACRKPYARVGELGNQREVIYWGAEPQIITTDALTKIASNVPGVEAKLQRADLQKLPDFVAVALFPPEVEGAHATFKFDRGDGDGFVRADTIGIPADVVFGEGAYFLLPLRGQ